MFEIIVHILFILSGNLLYLFFKEKIKGKQNGKTSKAAHVGKKKKKANKKESTNDKLFCKKKLKANIVEMFCM